MVRHHSLRSNRNSINTPPEQHQNTTVKTTAPKPPPKHHRQDSITKTARPKHHHHDHNKLAPEHHQNTTKTPPEQHETAMAKIPLRGKHRNIAAGKPVAQNCPTDPTSVCLAMPVFSRSIAREHRSLHTSVLQRAEPSQLSRPHFSLALSAQVCSSPAPTNFFHRMPQECPA